MPNNDIAPARKKRIEKAQEFGAVWARDWSDEVTHVIADMYLRLSDVKKAVGHDRLKVRLGVAFDLLQSNEDTDGYPSLTTSLSTSHILPIVSPSKCCCPMTSSNSRF